MASMCERTSMRTSCLLFPMLFLALGCSREEDLAKVSTGGSGGTAGSGGAAGSAAGGTGGVDSGSGGSAGSDSGTPDASTSLFDQGQTFVVDGPPMWVTAGNIDGDSNVDLLT